MEPTPTRRRHTVGAAATLIVLGAAIGSACGASSDPTSAGDSTPASSTTSALAPAPASAPDLLVGSWSADQFITVGGLRPVPVELAMSIRFDSGSTVKIETRCSEATAPVAYSSDPTFGTTLSVGVVAITPTSTCGDSAVDVERGLLEMFGHPLGWEVNDGRLTLLPTDVTDSGLILRAASTGSSDVDGTVAGLLAVAADHRVRTANGVDTPNVFSSVAILDTYGVADDDGRLDAAAGPVGRCRAVRSAMAAVTRRCVRCATRRVVG